MEKRVSEEEKHSSGLNFGDYEVLRMIRKDENEEIYEVRKKDDTDVSLFN